MFSHVGSTLSMTIVDLNMNFDFSVFSAMRWYSVAVSLSLTSNYHSVMI